MASFSEKRHAEKSKKTQLWMKMVKHSNSTWPSKIQAFVFINSSENKLGTLHVVELFSSISVDLQAQWQLQLDTSALVPGHGQSMSLVLNLCYNSALRALQVFFTFVFCCHCLHPFCLFVTRFVIVLSDLDSGQHYKLCLDMDGVSTALLPGQHSTQELRSEFCFFQYLKFKVFVPKIVFFLLKSVFSTILTFFKHAFLTNFALKDEDGHAEVYKLCKMCKCQKRSSATQIFISPVVLFLVICSRFKAAL